MRLTRIFGLAGLATLCLVATTASPETAPKALYYGFSQAGQGFCGVGGIKIEILLLENNCPQPAAVAGMDLVAVTKGGAAIEFWVNPQYEGYDLETYYLPKPPTVRIAKSEANILIMNISGGTRAVDEWASDIEQAVATMKSLHPLARRIYLQPVGTGPLDASGNPINCMQGQTVVRAVRNHPDIVSAIDRIIEHDAMAYTGLVARVSNCGSFADDLGHYNDDGGAAEVRAQIEDFYSSILTEVTDLIPPEPPTGLKALQ